MRRIARWTALPVALTLAGALAVPVLASSPDVQTLVNTWSGPFSGALGLVWLPDRRDRPRDHPSHDQA